MNLGAKLIMVKFSIPRDLGTWRQAQGPGGAT